MASLWRQLPSPQAGGAQLPPLLISTFFLSDKYTIYLTDLTYIWRESLNRRALFARSHEVNTSIDPTESDQLEIFLDKLKQGVNGGRNTTSAISVSSDTGRPTITLKITVDLPGGLAPLEWPFRLTPAPQSLLTAQLTVPLLQAQHNRMEEIDTLTELLKEKDHVIQKMLDKFEVQGLELGQVFPQAIAKGGRSLDRKRAEEKIKGLQAFDIETFRETLENKESLDAAQLVQSVLSSESQQSPRTNINSTLPEEDDNWWESIKGQTINVFGKGKTIVSPSADKSKPKPSSAPVRDESITEEEDFQVQATPPHVSRDSKREASTLADDSTEDEDDLDAAPSQRSKIADSQRSLQARVASHRKQSKIGIIGGKKTTSKTPIQALGSSDDEPTPPPNANKTTGLRSETAREGPSMDMNTTDEDFDPSARVRKLDSASSNQFQSHTLGDVDTSDDEPSFPTTKNIGRVSPKKARQVPSKGEDTDQVQLPTKSLQLGIVGGKKAAPTSDDNTTDDEMVHPDPPKRKGRLGTLGGKRPKQPPSSSDEEPATNPSKSKGKLGMLGGKIKQATPSTSTAKEPLDSQKSSPEPLPHAKKRLGTIGGNSKSTSAEESKEESPARERSVKKEETPLPEETAEEKADKKRLQLKRTLEEKSKAPVKKKKKF